MVARSFTVLLPRSRFMTTQEPKNTAGDCYSVMNLSIFAAVRGGAARNQVLESYSSSRHMPRRVPNLLKIAVAAME